MPQARAPLTRMLATHLHNSAFTFFFLFVHRQNSPFTFVHIVTYSFQVDQLLCTCPAVEVAASKNGQRMWRTSGALATTISIAGTTGNIGCMPLHIRMAIYGIHAASQYINAVCLRSDSLSSVSSTLLVFSCDNCFCNRANSRPYFAARAPAQLGIAPTDTARSKPSITSKAFPSKCPTLRYRSPFIVLRCVRILAGASDIGHWQKCTAKTA